MVGCVSILSNEFAILWCCPHVRICIDECKQENLNKRDMADLILTFVVQKDNCFHFHNMFLSHLDCCERVSCTHGTHICMASGANDMQSKSHQLVEQTSVCNAG